VVSEWIQILTTDFKDYLENSNEVVAVRSTEGCVFALALMGKVTKLSKILSEAVTKVLEAESQTQGKNIISELFFMLDQENWSCVKILATQS